MHRQQAMRLLVVNVGNRSVTVHLELKISAKEIASTASLMLADQPHDDRRSIFALVAGRIET